MSDVSSGGRVQKEWWRDFFKPVVGEVMFNPKAGRSEAEVRQVIKHSKIRAPLDVLDLACGVGRHSLIFASRGFRVTGLDYSEPYLREARRAARRAGAQIRFIRGDMKNLRPHFPENQFGLVASCSTASAISAAVATTSGCWKRYIMFSDQVGRWSLTPSTAMVWPNG